MASREIRLSLACCYRSWEPQSFYSGHLRSAHSLFEIGGDLDDRVWHFAGDYDLDSPPGVLAQISTPANQPDGDRNSVRTCDRKSRKVITKALREEAWPGVALQLTACDHLASLPFFWALSLV